MCDGDPLHVAVKALQENVSEEETVKFLQEAAVMGQFSHPNIASMYGVVTVDDPVSESLTETLCTTPFMACLFHNTDFDCTGVGHH